MSIYLSIYLFILNNHIHHPSFQHNHLDKFLIAHILYHILQNTPHHITIQNLKAHNNIIENDEANKVAKGGSTWDPTPLSKTPSTSYDIEIPCWHAWKPTSTQHDGSICNIQRNTKQVNESYIVFNTSFHMRRNG